MKHLLFTTLVFSLTACATRPPEPQAPAEHFRAQLIEKGELPKSDTAKVHCRVAYCIEFDENHKLAKWVAYRLKRDHVVSEANQRKDNWKPDPNFPALTSKDYERSGYDRGHLAPAEDFEWSKQAMDESFYYGNSAPQLPGYNRGIWLEAEKEARKLAMNHGEVLIVTGPVLERGLPRLRDNATIAKKFFKAVLVVDGSKLRAVAFVVPQDAKRKTLAKHVTSVDEIEKITGLDLFASYPDELESEFEVMK